SEAADVAAGTAQFVPEGVAGAHAAEPVVEDEHLDACPGALGERTREPAPHVVVPDDVVLEDDAAARARDRLQHRGKGGGSVYGQRRGVAERQRRFGRAAQRALEQRAEPGTQAAGCGTVSRHWERSGSRAGGISTARRFM